jgi:hypothetical protein
MLPDRKPVVESQPTTSYVGLIEGHWIGKNIGSGEFNVLEVDSLWEID